MTAPPDDLPRLSRARDASSTGYIEVTGRRAALLGDERGIFECWIWPLKIAHGVRLYVHHQQQRIAVGDLPGKVEVRPERVRLEHRHPLFRVQMTAFAALDRRALILLCDVDCDTDIELELVVEPDFRPMWPAGMGGQIGARDAESGAFLLTEELGRFAALIGSPEAAPPEQSADHALPRDPVSIRVRVATSRMEHGPIPFFLAGAEIDPGPLSDAARLGDEGAALGHARSAKVVAMARAEYARLAHEWPAMLEEHVQHWRDFLARTTTIETGDALHDEAFLWAKIAIEKCWVEVDGLGRGLVAGLATSGSGERPGFGWFFDGDAMVAARAMLAYGDFEGARRVLEFAASHQRADGKMMHELTLSARLCNWVEDYPYAYYKGVNTPDFIAAVAEYVETTDDWELDTRLWPHVARAFEQCLSCVDEDGLYSVQKAGLCAVEAGPLCGRIRSEVFAQGLWIAALQSVVSLAGGVGLEQFRTSIRARAESELARAITAFELFWSEPSDHHGFARMVDGSLCADATAFLAQPLSLRMLRQSERASLRSIRSLHWLNHPGLASDWGLRMFAVGSSVYDPAHYNTGSVFPYLNAFAILALYWHSMPTAAYQLLRSQLNLHGYSGLGYLPEHLRGDRAESPPRGVPHQLFSSTTVVLATLHGMLGLWPQKHASRLWCRVALPPQLDRVRIHDYRVGDRRIDIEFQRERGPTTTRLSARFVLQEGWSLAVMVLGPTSHVAESKLETSIELAIVHATHVELLVDAKPLEHGAESSGLRCGKHGPAPHVYSWTLHGRAGQTYRVRYFGGTDYVFEGAVVIAPGELEVRMPDGDPSTFVSTTVTAKRTERVV